MIKEVETASELMKILETENLTELVYEEDGIKIQLKREYRFEEKAAPKKEIPTKPVKAKENFVEVLSHRIGNFYPTVKNGESILVPGHHVKEGDEIGYILTMGVKNPVISDFSGKIVEVLAGEGAIVDFTKPILKLKK